MRNLPFLTACLALVLPAAPVAARDGCNSFVASVCEPAPEAAPDPAPNPAANPATVTPRTLRIAPRPPAFAVGDIFPLADHSPLMNPERYDLPPAGNGWRYYRIRPEVFRVDSATGRVLEIVTGGNRSLLR